MIDKDRIDKDKINGKYSDEKKNSPTFSASQKPNKADYFIFKAKKAYNICLIFKTACHKPYNNV